MDYNQKKNRIALGLMTSSLLLLVLVLAFWLHNVYQQELNLLKDRSSFVFINSMKDAESEFIKKELLPPLLELKTKEGDSIEVEAFGFDVKKQENLVIKKGIEVADSANIKLATRISITIEKDSLAANSKENGGAFLRWIVDARGMDSINNDTDSMILHSIKGIIAESPKIEELPAQFKVIRVEDTSIQFKGIISETYKDLDSGDSYALALVQPEGYVLKRMIPQISIAFFLFGITWLAFYFVYRNLKEQQNLTALKNDLISNITHELKTPISTVGVAIEALQSFDALKDPIKTEEYLGIAEQELNRLSILVDKVLNTALFEQTEIPLKEEPLNLKILTKGILNSMKLQFEQKNANVSFQTTGKDFVINGDRIHLTSVLYNLIDNGLKYSPLNPTLQLNLEANTQQIKFSIKDNGLGIPKAFQEKIFDKFFRIPTKNDHSIKGHGLGLNYVKKVIQKHGGAIFVQSEKGQGSQFTFTLPCPNLVAPVN